MDGLLGKLLGAAGTGPAKLAAGTLVGSIFGIFAAAGQKPVEASMVLYSVLGGGFLGFLATGILLLRDARRRRNPAWQRQADEKAGELLLEGSATSPEDARRQAERDLEEGSRGILFWFGMILGGFVMLCGLIMGILKIWEVLRPLF